jgi:hypothetical protein
MSPAPIAMTCVVCRTPNAVVPAPGGGVAVVCRACHRHQPVRLYEAQLAQGGVATGSALAPAGDPGPKVFLFPAAVACAVAAVGVAGVFTVGALVTKAPWANFMLIGMAMIFSALGGYQLRNPTRLRIAPIQGTDAWGNTQYGPSHQATRKEGITMGVISLSVGLAFLVLGVFIGMLTH